MHHWITQKHLIYKLNVKQCTRTVQSWTIRALATSTKRILTAQLSKCSTIVVILSVIGFFFVLSWDITWNDVQHKLIPPACVIIWLNVGVILIFSCEKADNCTVTQSGWKSKSMNVTLLKTNQDVYPNKHKQKETRTKNQLKICEVSTMSVTGECKKNQTRGAALLLATSTRP